MLPAPTPIRGGLLADVLDMWHAKDWDPASLHRFRMGPEDDQAVLDALSPEELDQLQELTDDDVTALNALTPEQRSALAGGGIDESDLPEKVKTILAKERTTAREAKQAKKTAERTARTEKERADRAEAELAALKKKGTGKADNDDPDEAIATARREAEEAATKRSNRAILEARIEAAAAGKLTSPALAVRLLDLDDFEVDEDGKVDRKAIDEALEELLEENPGLAVKKRGSGDGGGGPRGGRSGRPSGIAAGKAEAAKRFGTKDKQ